MLKRSILFFAFIISLAIYLNIETVVQSNKLIQGANLSQKLKAPGDGVSLNPPDTYWNSKLVRTYVHNSELQRRWALAFLAPHLVQLKGDEQILDIGCGDGKITADVSKFLPKGRILGIDPSLDMLEWAKKQYSQIEYPNLYFQEGGFLKSNISKSFDIIISQCALHHCSNQSQAFENLAMLLKPGGKLLIMVPALNNPAWKKARKIVQTTPKWSSYWKNIPPSQYLSLEEYEKLLKNAHFRPVKIIEIKTEDPFIDREEYLHFLLGTLNPVVPRDKAKEFYNELIDTYLRLLPEAVSSDGVVQARFGRIEIEAIYLESDLFQ